MPAHYPRTHQALKATSAHNPRVRASSSLLSPTSPQLHPPRRIPANKPINMCRMSSRNSRHGGNLVVPQRHDPFARGSENIQAALHVADGEVRCEIRVLAPLRAEDGQPPPGLAVVGYCLGGLELGGGEGRVEHELLRVDVEHWGQRLLKDADGSVAPVTAEK